MRREYVLFAFGALLFLIGLFVTASQGNPVPYAPGEDAPAARAAARTSEGYTSQGVTVYEGSVATITSNNDGFGEYHLTLTSGTPQIYAEQQGLTERPPAVSVGQHVRLWTAPGTDTRGNRQNYVLRMDVGSTTWLSGYSNYVSTPMTYQGGSAPVQSVLALGGMPVGLLLGAAGLAVIVRRQVLKAPARWRVVDHISIWSPIAALVLFTFWLRYVNFADANSALPLIPLIAVVLIIGLIAGSSGLAGRPPNTVPWPSLIGIVPGIFLLLALGLFGLAECSGAGMFA